MKYEVAQHSRIAGQFHAEAVGSDGEMYVAVFTGQLAKERAEEYAAWKNA